MIYSKLAAVLAAASIPFTAVQAEAAPQEHLVFVGSVDVETGFWEADLAPGASVLLSEFDDGPRQHWHWDLDAETFTNALTLQCLTADGGAVRYAPCDEDADAQRWERQPLGDPGATPSLFVNAASGTCVTHDGVQNQLVLEYCDPARAEQQWNIYLV
ncbi:ricin-type beta-trefoil lectin domain protein [Actinokineospora sp. G85]|uniref:ricin-type beta-trefoil lectin domain protein n=1 Tax=Actinokineospora sp. G85 TaxID=3406626 RepID=UPI003C731F3D